MLWSNKSHAAPGARSMQVIVWNRDRGFHAFSYVYVYVDVDVDVDVGIF